MSESDPLGEIHDLYAYNRWANLRVLDAAGRLQTADLERDLGSSFPSVLATLAHLVSSEWVWLRRWRGTSPTGIPDSWDLASLSAVEERWREVEEERTSFLAGLAPDDLSAGLEYRTTSGREHRAPLWQLLRHVVNHSTYHRGQVATMLRQLGHEPVATDLVLFHREGAPGR